MAKRYNVTGSDYLIRGWIYIATGVGVAVVAFVFSIMGETFLCILPGLIVGGIFALVGYFYLSSAEKYKHEAPVQPTWSGDYVQPGQSAHAPSGVAPSAGPPCGKCGQPLTYIQQHSRWYCNKCGKYV